MKHWVFSILLLLLASPVLAGDYALEFTTGNDYVEVPYDASLNLPDGVTIETWIRIDNISISQVIIAKSYAATHISPYFEWDMWYKGGSGFEFRIGADVWTTGYSLGQNDTCHVVFTADGTKWRLYEAGIPQDSTEKATLPANTNSRPVLMGNNVASGEEFDGMIDEVRIYNGALSASDISDHYNSGAGTCDHATDNLKGDWHFSEGSGTTTADNSGNGNTANLLPEAGEPSWITGIGLDCHAEAAPGAQVIIIRGQ